MLQLIGKGYSDLEMAVFAYIADALDASGYYTEPLDDIVSRFGITEEKAAACLAIMKGLEPAGVCAASLQEPGEPDGQAGGRAWAGTGDYF